MHLLGPHTFSAACWVAFALVLLGAKAEEPILKGHRNQLQLRPRDQCPGTYTFGLGTVHIVQHRSLQRDTVYIGASLIVNDTGRITSYNLTKRYGKHSNGRFLADIEFQDIQVSDSAVAVLGYVVFNIAHGSQKDVKKRVQKAAYAIAVKGSKAAAARPKTPVAEVVLDIALSLIKRIGSILGVIPDLINAGKHGCDGWTGAGVHGFKGSDICLKRATNQNNLTGTDQSKGSMKSTLPGIICSIKRSHYNVGWFAGSRAGLGNITELERLNDAPSVAGAAGGAWLIMLVVGGFLALF
ncbi:MAG: hypothetical protein M1840_006007 [Geoglossum simile]|nr:MAG: hypothetical protein M1840_006007 [Geoglossum simile]